MYTDSQAAYWDRVAGEKTFTHPLDMELLARYAAKDAMIIDYGCGYGRLVKQLLDAGYTHITGYDTSAGLIARGCAYGSLPLKHFPDPQVFDTMVPDASADVILLFAVLTCVPSNSAQKDIIALVCRKLKPGGILYISDYYLQADRTEVGSYTWLNDDKENYGVFTLPEGATFRHHNKEWMTTLLNKLTPLEHQVVPVRTMNGSTAEAFQIIAQKSTMNILMTTQLTAEQKAAIMRLWNAEYPAQLGYKEMSYFDNYLAALQQQRHWLYYNDNGDLRGWAFTFQREHDTWFAIIVAHTLHRKGVGTSLLNQLKQHHTLLNGWVTDHDRYKKQDGTPYPSPMPFYLANDFTICPETRLEIEVLSAVKIQWKAS